LSPAFTSLSSSAVQCFPRLVVTVNAVLGLMPEKAVRAVSKKAEPSGWLLGFVPVLSFLIVAFIVGCVPFTTHGVMVALNLRTGVGAASAMPPNIDATRNTATRAAKLEDKNLRGCVIGGALL
jgi:hypothetical protein